jgi:hypothetical protein
MGDLSDRIAIGTGEMGEMREMREMGELTQNYALERSEGSTLKTFPLLAIVSNKSYTSLKSRLTRLAVGNMKDNRKRSSVHAFRRVRSISNIFSKRSVKVETLSLGGA